MAHAPRRHELGTGPDRGIALVFVVAGVVGLVATGLALGSRSYHRLAAPFDDDAGTRPEPAPGVALP